SRGSLTRSRFQRDTLAHSGTIARNLDLGRSLLLERFPPTPARRLHRMPEVINVARGLPWQPLTFQPIPTDCDLVKVIPRGLKGYRPKTPRQKNYSISTRTRRNRAAPSTGCSSRTVTRSNPSPSEILSTISG